MPRYRKPDFFSSTKLGSFFLWGFRPLSFLTHVFFSSVFSRRRHLCFSLAAKSRQKRLYVMKGKREKERKSDFPLRTLTCVFRPIEMIHVVSFRTRSLVSQFRLHVILWFIPWHRTDQIERRNWLDWSTIEIDRWYCSPRIVTDLFSRSIPIFCHRLNFLDECHSTNPVRNWFNFLDKCLDKSRQSIDKCSCFKSSKLINSWSHVLIIIY